MEQLSYTSYGDPVSVLLGGLITLAVTALVQIVIIPWVQVRTRRRDRWEKDVIELDVLIRWELPSLLSRQRDAAIGCGH